MILSVEYQHKLTQTLLINSSTQTNFWKFNYICCCFILLLLQVCVLHILLYSSCRAFAIITLACATWINLLVFSFILCFFSVWLISREPLNRPHSIQLHFYGVKYQSKEEEEDVGREIITKLRKTHKNTHLTHPLSYLSSLYFVLLKKGHYYTI